MIKRGLALALLAILWQGTVIVALFALADKCYDDGGRWCAVSPAGDGYHQAPAERRAP